MTVSRAGAGRRGDRAAAALLLTLLAACSTAPRVERLSLPAPDEGAAARRLRAVAAAPIALPAPDAIVLLHTNDVHGSLRGRTIRVGGAEIPAGGTAALATFVRRWNESAGGETNVLFLDAGDLFQGTPEGKAENGLWVIEAMNRLGYDAAALGNHDLDLGIDAAARLSRAARFPILCANLRDRATGRVPGWMRPTWTTEIRGVTIGVVGAITEDLPRVSGWGPRPPLLLLPATVSIREAVRDLEQRGAEIVVVLSHLGYANENVADDSDVARLVPGVDIIVGGHSHTFMREACRDESTGVWVLQAGGNGTNAGEALFRYDRAADRVVDFRWRLVPLLHEAFPDDPATAEALRPRFEEIDRTMNEVVGTATGRFWRSPRGDTPPASPMGILLARAYAEAAGASIGIVNVGGVRDEIETGPVRLRDLFEVAPFGNTISAVELSGAEVRTLFESCLSGPARPVEVFGATVYYDPSQAPGRRLVDVVLDDGKPVRLDGTYVVAANSFMAQGGDGFDVLRLARTNRETGAVDLDALRRIFEAGPVTPSDARPYRSVP